MKVLDYLPSHRIKVQNKYNFRCPICGDSKKSMTKARGWWFCAKADYHCYNCGANMSGIKFIELMSGENFYKIKDEYLRLYLKSGLDLGLSANVDAAPTEPSLFDFKQMVKNEWKNDLSDAAKEYLSNRKVLNAPFLAEPLYSTYSKNKEEFILIPWVINGVDAYFQLNDFQKLRPMKYIFPKNEKKLLYGLDNIDLSWPYIICFEGVYDSLFVKNAIATGTKSLTEYQLDIIKQRYPKHKICVSFDNDIPGMSSMVKMIKQNKNVKFFRWFNRNTKQKDINDYVLYKNDINLFTDPKKLERMISDPVMMKLYLVENNLWNVHE